MQKILKSMVLTTKSKWDGYWECFLSAAILFMGNTFQCIKELMEVINVSFISRTTFSVIQKKYLLPAVHRLHTTYRQLIIDNAAEKWDIDLLGDRRCDSLCYNTKNGKYTVLDKILD